MRSVTLTAASGERKTSGSTHGGDPRSLCEYHLNFVFSHGIERGTSSGTSSLTTVSICSTSGTPRRWPSSRRRRVWKCRYLRGDEASSVCVEEVIGLFRDHLGPSGGMSRPSGRQRVIFLGLNGMAGGPSWGLPPDPLGRTYAQGASFFDGKVGDGVCTSHPRCRWSRSEIRRSLACAPSTWRA